MVIHGNLAPGTPRGVCSFHRASLRQSAEGICPKAHAASHVKGTADDLAIFPLGDRYFEPRLRSVSPYRTAVVFGALVAVGTASACATSPCPPLSPRHMPLPPPRPPAPAPEPGSEDQGVCAITPDLPTCATRNPRCSPTDPTCGPEFVNGSGGPEVGWPVWHGPHNETGAMCLRPDAPRYPVRHQSSVDACTHDGECRVIGCGDCVSSRRPAGAGCMSTFRIVPPDAKPLPLQWCGCVDGRCTTFTQ